MEFSEVRMQHPVYLAPIGPGFALPPHLDAFYSTLHLVVVDKDALRWMGAMKATPVHSRAYSVLEIAKAQASIPRGLI